MFNRRGFIDLYPLYYNVVARNGEVTSRSQMYSTKVHAKSAARLEAQRSGRKVRDRRPLHDKSALFEDLT